MTVCLSYILVGFLEKERARLGEMLYISWFYSSGLVWRKEEK